MTKNLLTNLKITEISLVDDPANEEARVEIWKSRAGKPEEMPDWSAVTGAVVDAITELAPTIVQKALAAGGAAAPGAETVARAIVTEIVMDLEAVAKALETAEARITEITKRADDAEAAVAAKEAEITKMKAELTPAATSDEEVLKGLPEVVRKRLEAAEQAAAAAQDEVRKSREKGERDTFVAKAKSLKVGDPEKVGDLMMRVAKGKTEPTDVDMIDALLRQAATIASQSPLFKSLGGAAAVDGDPDEVVKAKAEAIRKAKPGTTFEQAYDEVMRAEPHLYDAVLAKRRPA